MNWNILKQDMMTMWLMATIALCVGLLINQFRDKPLPLIYQSKGDRLDVVVTKMAETPKMTENRQPTLQRELTLEQFRSFVESKSGLVLDARPEIFHRLGHVPGALSLPRDDFETSYLKLRGLLEKNKSQAIVLYCSSSSCEDSALVLKALTKLGYTNIAVFHGGWSEWTQAGLKEENTQ